MEVWRDASLDWLRQHVIHTYRQGGGSRPDVNLIDKDGQKAVLKDHNACDRGFRLIIGPLLVWREAKALVRLREINGIPNLYATPDARSLLMEHLPGKQIGDCERNLAWGDFFNNFERLLQEMHTLGVAHCDLRNPGNVLVREDNQPAIVDFVSCVFRGPKWNILSRWIFDKFSQADRDALAKLKKRVAPELLTSYEERVLFAPTRLERVARTVGTSIRNLGRWLFTRHTR